MTSIIKKYTVLFVIAIITIAFYSCEKEIDVDLNSVIPRITIEGLVKQNAPAMVRVSQTIDFNDRNEYPFLEGAIVKIWDDAGNSETLKQNSTGWYVAEHLTGEENRTYNLSVIYDDTEYTASSYMPPLVKIDSLSMYKVLAMDYALPMVHFTDPVGDVNKYYRYLVYINGKQRSDTDEIVTSTEFTDGSPMHVLLPVFSEDDDVDPIEKGDDILIEFQCLDKDSYTFYDTLSDISNSLTNPTTNIKGGALGVFCAYSHDRMSITATWK